MNSVKADAWTRALARCAALQPVRRGTLDTEPVLERPPFALRRYCRPDSLPPPWLPPLLLVYSLVNRPDLLDLAPGRSLAMDLLAAGFPVYLVDWGYPLDADRGLDMEDYVPGFLAEAVDAVLEREQAPQLTLAGVCQGGTLGLCHAALRPDGIGHLLTLATPVDFHARRNALSQLALTLPPGDGPELEDNIPGFWLSAAFAGLKPVELLFRRYQALPELDNNGPMLEEFMRLEAWMYDCPDQPAVMFRRFVADFYQQNRLVEGTLRLDGEAVDLGCLAMPVLNVYARQDHLVPAESARALARLVPSTRYRECPLPGGHLGVFLSGRNRNRFIPELVNLLATDL